MADIKLFRLAGESASEIQGTSVALEKSLQSIIENHLETLLGVRFLASEYSTGKVHGGRMDTLGIDENGCPVIIMPIGMPPVVNPHGIECEGCPVVSNTPVKFASSPPAMVLPGAGVQSTMVGV